jgi:hypothetical protein
MEYAKRLAEYEAKAAEAERNAANASDPQIAREWSSVAQVYRVMIETLRRSAH